MHVTRRVTCTWWLLGLAAKAPWLGASRKGGTGGGGWGHPQGDMHMVAARLGCQSAMVGTGWANSCHGCMDRLRKRYSYLVGSSFLAGNVAWTRRVTCTWWLLGLAAKAPWLRPGGPTPAMAAWTGLENATLTL